MTLKRSDLMGGATGLSGAHRLSAIQYVFLAMFILIGLRLWSLQVVNHQTYATRAESNRLKTLPVPAARGLILDREGRVIVDNRPTLSLVVSREEAEALGKKVLDVIDDLIAQGVKLDREDVQLRLQAMRRQPRYFPVIIKTDADPEDVAWVRAHQLEHPELDVIEQPQRLYPHGAKLAHVVGYVGEISQQQLAQPEYQDEYRPGDIIGRAGVEKIHDPLLRGRDGMRRVLVDSTGREMAQIERLDPITGFDVRLTIDLDLQRVAEEQLGARRGAIVALDPRNGEILAYVSRPAFDPNLFSRRLATPEGKAEYRALVDDPQRPLLNRPIQGRYPTGSTWKVLVATAALQEGLITRRESHLSCGGGIQVGNRFVRCMGFHGAPDIHRALVVSCDGYFYRLGLKLGIDRLHDWVERMGLGQRTGIDLPNEYTGIIPGRDIKARWNPRDPVWRDHDTVIASIGQGSVAVTPLQLLRAVAGISMGGKLYTPHLFLEASSPERKVEYEPKPPRDLHLSEPTRDIIRQGMWGVVNEYGTGTRARVPEFDVCGKTGTAQVVAVDKATGALKDHAWFVAFAPRDNPEIAVVVLVENVGFGGTHSAPIARAIFEAYYNKHYGPPTPVDVEIVGDDSEAEPPTSGSAGSVPAPSALYLAFQTAQRQRAADGIARPSSADSAAAAGGPILPSGRNAEADKTPSASAWDAGPSGRGRQSEPPRPEADPSPKSPPEPDPR